MNYLYFAESTVDGAGDAGMWPASSFLGIDPVSTTTSRISFKAIANTAADDDILITHANKEHEKVAEAIAMVLEPQPGTRGKMIVVADQQNGVYLDVGNGAGITGTVTVTAG